MGDQPEARKGPGYFVLKTERDFYNHIENRLKQEGFEILDLFAPSQPERRSAAGVAQEGA
jgi:hypothetical protein